MSAMPLPDASPPDQLDRWPVTRWPAIDEVPVPLLRHGHSAGDLCEICDRNVRTAASAVVGAILASMSHAPVERTARARGWGALTRIGAAGTAGTRVAFDHLAGLAEAGACEHQRDALGAPALAEMITPVPGPIADDLAGGIALAQRYLCQRAAARAMATASAAPPVVDQRGARVALAALAMAAAAAAMHHHGPGPLYVGRRPGRGEVAALTAGGTDQDR